MHCTSHPPRNCHFHIANAARRLPFDDNTFDFVVQHDAVFLYTQKEWKAAIDELVRVTKPGGWIQLGNDFISYCTFSLTFSSIVEPSGILQDIGPSLSIWLMRSKLHDRKPRQTTLLTSPMTSQLQYLFKHVIFFGRLAPSYMKHLNLIKI